MQKLVSIDIFADFGMLKKPDTNEPIYLTFNMLHKPSLLGILGAIAGESGFKEKGVLPDYYLSFQDLKIGIQPLNHEKGNFQKTTVTYNNTTGMASKEQGGNLMITEQTLVAPAYRCYFFFDTENETHRKADENLSKYYAEYLPYLGKNEFSVWWKKYTVHDFEEFKPNESFKIKSIYIKNQPVEGSKYIQAFSPFSIESGNTFSYFERLPIGYTDIGNKNYQYKYESFAFTNWTLKANYEVNFMILKLKNNGIIQVF
ncbi:MAG: type I-B CRISPR-associated protein Cas5 [Bacteroidetes bacterium]|jgi:CRISPR-associated protein Cas5h|nr:type I-B CRISPR-associated protein Cas5 [Bacteroidota bacterium]MBT6687730.1 type I-B CRISPR-associated protein Cas5 [Bacteroidota bacterium]MBT7143676.1 type I-B CRISPR-associated protein Cas5 [Bacteroidota bacterium]MBT7493282.1 type I-B CRISPR-associated protein Cas5 [Bacteroidota bacterium]